METMDWLLEDDPENPGVRYFALRDLVGLAEEAPEVRQARQALMASGPVPVILAAQQPEGYWYKPGTGYSPKYRSTVWQIMFLAELGADPQDERVRRGCEYLLSHSLAENDAFSYNNPPRSGGTVHCLNGNLLHALIRLGYSDDPRVQAALGWMARAITGERGMHYPSSGTTGPEFACSDNSKLPCGWGAAKAMRALLALPPEQRTAPMQRATQAGEAFLLRYNLAAANYPFDYKISQAWFKFGFPLSYWSDVLETTGILVDLGYAQDARLAGAFELILSKRDQHGRWKLGNSLKGKMWVDIERQGRPSKWITLRALRVLKRAGIVID